MSFSVVIECCQDCDATASGCSVDRRERNSLTVAQQALTSTNRTQLIGDRGLKNFQNAEVRAVSRCLLASNWTLCFRQGKIIAFFHEEWEDLWMRGEMKTGVVSD